MNVTSQMLETRVVLINRALQLTDKMGEYKLDIMKGCGIRLVRVAGENGITSDVSPRSTKRELLQFLDGMLEVLRVNKTQETIYAKR